MRMLVVESLRKGLPALLLACVLTACGPDDSQDGPATFNWNLTVTPTSLPDVPVPADPLADPDPCANNPGFFSTAYPFVATVTNESGVPLGNVDLDIFLELAPILTQFAGAPGVIALSATTDDDGTFLFFIQFWVANGCAYEGSITVKSGALVTQAKFKATVQ